MPKKLGPDVAELDAYIEEMRIRGEKHIIIEDDEFYEGEMKKDYSDVTFRNVTFGQHQSHKAFEIDGDLDHTKFEDCQFYSNILMRGDFANSEFKNCQFNPPDPYGKHILHSFDSLSNFSDAIFDNCDMPAMKLKGNFINTKFNDCNMAYMSFNDGRWPTTVENIEFTGRKLNMPYMSFNKATNVENIALPQDGRIGMIRIDSPTPADYNSSKAKSYDPMDIDDFDTTEDIEEDKGIRWSKEPIDIKFHMFDEHNVPCIASARIDDPRTLIQSGEHYYLTNTGKDIDVTLEPVFKDGKQPDAEHTSIDFHKATVQNIDYLLANGTYTKDPEERKQHMVTLKSIDEVKSDTASVSLEMQTKRGDIITCQIEDLSLGQINPEDMTARLGKNFSYALNIPSYRGKDPKTTKINALTIAHANQQAQATKQQLIDFGPKGPKGGPNGPSGPNGPEIS